MNLALDFDVSSQCGTNTADLYRLDIKDLSAQKKDGARLAQAQKYPAFFAVNKATGVVNHIYTAELEEPSLVGIKRALITSLTRKMDTVAQAKAISSGSAEFDFSDVDASGPYSAHHILSKDTKGRLVAVESKEYKSKADAPAHLPVRHKLKASATFAADGSVSLLSQTDKLAVGQDSKSEVKSQTPDLGVATMTSEYKLRRLANRHLVDCATAKSMLDIESQVRGAIGTFVKAAPSTALLLPSSGAMSSDMSTTLLQASTMLAGQFAVNDLSELLSPITTKLVVDHAWQLLRDDSLDTDGMKKVLGALARVRSTDSYDALLAALRDKSLNPELRQQAAISLIHDQDEAHAPGFVLASVAGLAKDQDDDMSSPGLLLLGALLDGNKSPQAAKHRAAILSELQSLDHAKAENVPRTVALIGALENAGDSSALVNLLALMSSPQAAVRVAALDAVKALKDKSASDVAPTADLDVENLDDEDILSAGMADTADDDLADMASASLLLDVDKTKSSHVVLTHDGAVSGNADIGVSAAASLSSKWSHSGVGAFGHVSIRLASHGVDRPLLHVSFDGDLSPKAGAKDEADTKGSDGTLTLRTSVLGKRLLAAVASPHAPDFLIERGECPTKTSSNDNGHPAAVWYRPLASSSCVELLGIVPVAVREAASGAIGASPALQGHLGCGDHPKEQRAVVGVNAHGTVHATSSAVAHGFADSLGAKASSTVLDAELPAAVVSSTTNACGHFDLHQRPLSGTVDVVTHGRVADRVVNWRGAETDADLASHCVKINAGDFIAGEAAPAPKQVEAAPEEDIGELVVDGNPSAEAQAQAQAVVNQKNFANHVEKIADRFVEKARPLASEAGVAAANAVAARLQKQGDEVKGDVANANANAVKTGEDAGKAANAAGNQAAAAANADAALVAGNVKKSEREEVAAVDNEGDKAVAAANAAGATAQKVGGQVKQTARNVGRRGRDADAAEGAKDRQTTRDATAQVGAQEDANAKANRATVRKEAATDRKTTRDAERRGEKAVNAAEQQEKNLARRTEDRILKAFKRQSGAEDRKIDRMQREMLRMEHREERKEEREDMRRQAKMVVDEDKEIEQRLNAEEERRRLRHVEDAEKKGVKDLKSKLDRESGRRQQRREAKRVKDEAKTDFADETEKDRFQQMRRELRRQEGVKDNERRNMDRLKDQMRNEEQQEGETQKLDRMEGRIEKDAEGAQKQEQEIEGIGKEVQQEAQQEINNEEKTKEQVEGEMQREQAAQREQQGVQSIENQNRREQAANNEQREADKTQGEVSEEGAADRKTERETPGEVEGEVNQEGNQQQEEQQAAQQREETRQEGQEGREQDRQTGQQNQNQQQRNQDKEQQDEVKVDIEGKIGKEDKNQDREQHKMDRKVRRDGRKKNHSLAKAQRQAARAARRAAKILHRSQAHENKKLGRRTRAYSRKRTAQFRRANHRSRRQRRTVRRRTRRATKNWGRERRHNRRRLKRQRRRERRRQDRMSGRQSRRQGRVEQRASDSLTQYRHKQTREMARRSGRKQNSFASVAASASKRFSRQKRHLQNRAARTAARATRRLGNLKAQISNKMARTAGRIKQKFAKHKRRWNSKIARTEARAAGELSAQAKRFGNRMGRVQQRMVALLKPYKK